MSQNSSKIQKTKSGWYHILRTYGITEEEFHALDKGHCPICLRDWGENVRPCVDHDHKTQEIRGLVCLYCNHRVIGRHRDPELLQRAADYLRAKRPGHLVPKKKRKKRVRKSRTKRS